MGCGVEGSGLRFRSEKIVELWGLYSIQVWGLGFRATINICHFKGP